MSVDKQEGQAGKDKVSGLDSFEDSLHTSTNEVEHMSMHERLFWVSSKAAGRGTSQDTGNRTGSVADMEVDKQKRVNERSTGATQKGDDKLVGAIGAELGIAPAKRYKASSSRPTNLTGTHVGSRQEQ